MPQVKKIPMRMCTGCRERRPKKELVRVVRTPEGEICIDKTGKKSGRGAYLCADNAACLKKAIKSKALDRALESTITEEIYQQLAEQMSGETP